MSSGPEREAVRLAGSELGPHRHVCAFFHNDADRYRILLPFIEEGFAAQEAAVHIVDPRRRAEHTRQLRSIGIDPARAEADGQLEIREWRDAHLQDGTFDPARMLALVEDIRERSRARGFDRIRFITHMEWALEDCAGVDRLLEYEARANMVPLEDTVVCAYDLARFSADVVIDVLRTHPMVIVGDVLQENPFFVPPEQFLCELGARRAR